MTFVYKLARENLEPGTEYQASREAWNQMLITVLMKCRNRLPAPAFNIFQQNRTDVEANVESVSRVIVVMFVVCYIN